jgi:uncharacterized coiled-coil DUF342 family protein
MEKFNGKYSDLYPSQKEILREYINSVDSTPVLRDFYNTKIQEVKNELNTFNQTISDKTVQIKVNEVLNLLHELDKTSKVTSENIVNILQYYELLEELKSAHGQVAE